MPMGVRQTNNILYITLDVWQDKIYYNEKEYPAGYFANAILNVPMEMIAALTEKGGRLISSTDSAYQAQSKEELKALLPVLRSLAKELIGMLYTVEPFSLCDLDAELGIIDQLMADRSLETLLARSTGRDFTFQYLARLAAVPMAICHFWDAGRYLEANYLHRLKKRNESTFAIAAHDCFTDPQFLTLQNDLPGKDWEPFTFSPNLRSSYCFARNPRDEKEMVFVNRVIFERYMDFFCYDLFNGMHHGHAPSRCENCDRFFLTLNGHTPRYCDGAAPQDQRYTCRQLGASMHQKEKNENHPVFAIYKTRTNTIRKHFERGRISRELRDESLRLCEDLRDRALFDNDFASGDYILFMGQNQVYTEARKRLGGEDLGDK